MIDKLQKRLDFLNIKREKSGLTGRKECEALDILDEIRECEKNQDKKMPEFRLTGG